MINWSKVTLESSVWLTPYIVGIFDNLSFSFGQSLTTSLSNGREQLHHIDINKVQFCGLGLTDNSTCIHLCGS